MTKLEELVHVTRHMNPSINDAPITAESTRFRELTDELAKITPVQFEAYFGQNPYVQKIVLKFQAIKDVLAHKIGQTLNSRDLARIDTHCAELDAILAKMMNIETATIQIVPGSGLNTIPVGVGLIDLTKYEGMTDKEAMDEYNAYEIDKLGVHYKHPEGKHMIISIGSTLFANPEMKPEFIAALLFREIGRSFLNFTFGVSIQAQRCIYGAVETIDIFQTVQVLHAKVKKLIGIIDEALNTDFKAMFEWFKDYFKSDNATTDDVILATTTAKEIGFNMVFFFGFFSSIVNFIKRIPTMYEGLWMNVKKQSGKVQKERKNSLKGMKVDTTEKADSAWGAAFEQILMLFNAFMTLFGTYSIAIKFLQLNPIRTTSIFDLGKNLGADKFPGYYGLGPEYAKALIVYDKIVNKQGFEQNGIAKPFKEIPGLNVATQLPLLLVTESKALASGDLAAVFKINNMIHQLEAECNSPDLDPKLRTELKAELAELRRVYDDYIDPEKAKAEQSAVRCMIYYIFRYFKTADEKKVKKIDRTTNALIGLEVWKSSKDIAKMLKISPTAEANLSSVIESSINLTTESSSVFDQEIAWKQHFEDSTVYDSIKAITNEAYFGKNAIVKKSINYVKQIRAEFPKIKGKLTEVQKVSLKTTLEAWGNDLAKEFNAESCYIGLEDVYNAFCYPMSIGDRNDIKAMANNKILETSTGFRYSESKGVHMVMIIGVRILTDYKLSDETIVGILFHEIGHGFEQFENLSVQKSRSLSIYGSFCSTLKSLVWSLLQLNIIQSIQLFFALISGVFTGFGFLTSRKKYIEDAQTSTKELLDGLEMGSNGLKFPVGGCGTIESSSGLIAGLINWIQSLVILIFTYLPLPGVSSFVITIVSDPLILPDLVFKGRYYQVEKKNEKFADSFAAKYGLSMELSKFLYQIHTKAYDDATHIPILRSIEQFNTYGVISMLSLVDEHPTEIARIESMRKTLQHEIIDNKDLPQTLRAKAQIELDEIDKLHAEATGVGSNFKEGRSGVGMVMWILRVFKRLKKDSKNAAEFAAPIATTKVNLFKEMILAYNSDKRIEAFTGLKQDAVENEKTLVAALS